MSKLIRIICDGGGSLGFGNLRRSTTLGQGLRKSGFRVHVEAVSDLGQKLLPQISCDDGREDLRILDLPYNGDEWVISALSGDIPVLALDYQGLARPDLIISVFERKTAPRAGRHLVGLTYAIVRHDIVELSPTFEGSGVVIVIGGGDATGLGGRAAHHLGASGEIVTLIDGPLAVPPDVIPPNTKYLRTPQDIAAKMSTCRWAVTSGGGAMLEMMCLGKATHVLPRTPHETALAEMLLREQAILGIGLGSIKIPSYRRREQVGKLAHKLVDGHGVSRIIQAMKSLL